MDFLIDFITNSFSNCIWLAVALIALCPFLESKISIPLALNSVIWGASALSPLCAFLISTTANIIPSFFIILISKKLRGKTTGFLSNNITSHFSTKTQKIDKKYTSFQKYLALTGFVAIPLPLTGVWSSSIIAGLTNLDTAMSLLSIFIGAIISSGATTLLCCAFQNSIGYILIISLIIIVLFMFIDLILHYLRKYKKTY